MDFMAPSRGETPLCKKEKVQVVCRGRADRGRAHAGSSRGDKSGRIEDSGLLNRQLTAYNRRWHDTCKRYAARQRPATIPIGSSKRGIS